MLICCIASLNPFVSFEDCFFKNLVHYLYQLPPVGAFQFQFQGDEYILACARRQTAYALTLKYPPPAQSKLGVKQEMTEILDDRLRKIGITISKPILAVLCIVFGVLAIAWEPLLRFIVGTLFILLGVLLLIENMENKNQTQTPPPPPSP